MKLTQLQKAIILALREENNVPASVLEKKTHYSERQIRMAFNYIEQYKLGNRYKDYYFGEITTFYKINLLGKMIEISD